ncbi:sensor histidine kinase [Paenibacillus sp. 1001270B_150601_E10]|uniref:sensor histidine kinase n=1 Tax=Paenibacillus sp. 1001270B_150601_E10 TaxID=2787079 RepID=UPI0018A0E46A|nr:histidine kinase [Paenibacillus sp. 1001270B_150601_E10]
MLNVFRKWFPIRRRRHIQFRLTVTFLLILLPLVLVSWFAINKSKDIVYHLAVDRSKIAMSQALSNLDMTLQSMGEITSLVATDEQLLDILNKHKASITPEAIVDFAAMIKELSIVQSINPMVEDIAMYHSPSHMLLSTKYGGEPVTSADEQEWLSRMSRVSGADMMIISAHNREGMAQSLFSKRYKDGIVLLRTMDLYNADRSPYVLLMSLNMRKLQAEISSLLPSSNAAIYLQDEEGSVLLSSDPKESMLADIGEDAVRVTVQSENRGWNLTMIQPKQELFTETNVLKYYINAIIIISVLLALGISWVIYQSIASPIKRLVAGMKRLQSGDLDIKLSDPRQDEFGYLMRTFDQMAATQKNLIENIYEKELQIVSTELHVLQTQIQPHFLYNTLDSIYWTALNYDAEEISEMVLHLSKFFRLSLQKGAEEYTIEESIAHLESYIRIQQIRFMDSFDVEVYIQDEVRSIPILKLLLQPIVENAILHGLEGKQENGLLRIDCRLLDSDDVCISIEDNGPGVPKDRLMQVKSRLETIRTGRLKEWSMRAEDRKDMYGIQNVASRLKLVYGADGKLSIDSKEGHGTKVQLVFPPHSNHVESINRDKSASGMKEVAQ